ncbi:MAG: tetratricopeptide repeat protein, partial [Victivallaceae bacterium]
YDTRLFWWLLIAGPLFFAGIEMAIRRRLRAAANPAVLRLAAARKRRAAVIAALKLARNSAELGDAVHREVAPLVCDALDLPPGTTAGELSSKLNDPELVRAMQSSGEDAYRPGGESLELESARAALINGLKKLFVIGFAFAAMSFLGAAEVPRTDAGADLKAGAAAYDAGDFARACKIYDACLIAGEIDPAVYYNLGCANYMAHNYPEAIVRFEQARRLVPTDSAALENLNLARHQLGLPETGRVNSPMELGIYLRDRLRPEQWLVFAGVAWVLAFAALAFRRKLGPIRSRILTAALFALFLLGAVLAWSELATSYHSGRAFALGGGAPLKSLPGPTGHLEGEVPAGHELSIVEHRSDYSLVRYGNLQGWVENRFIRPVFR